MKMKSLRPQILMALIILGIAILGGLYYGVNEISTVAIGGVIALGKDLLNDSE